MAANIRSTASTRIGLSTVCQVLKSASSSRRGAIFKLCIGIRHDLQILWLLLFFLYATLSSFVDFSTSFSENELVDHYGSL